MVMRGFTVFELTLATLFGIVLLGSAATSVIQDTTGTRLLMQADVPTLAAQKAMETIAEEISMASVVAEDRDGDGVLGDSEDLNANGLLDADWSLADGTTSSTLTFNRRFDLVFGSGERPSAAYSRAIRYQLDGEQIVRVTSYSSTGQVLRTTLAPDVDSLRFTRRGNVVHVDIVIHLADGQTRTLAKSVLLRE
jgi:hypothetical protein